MESQNDSKTERSAEEGTSPNIKIIDFKEAMDEVPDLGSKVNITMSSTQIITEVGSLSKDESASQAKPLSQNKPGLGSLTKDKSASQDKPVPQNKPVTLKISIPKGMTIEEFLASQTGKTMFLSQGTLVTKPSKPDTIEKIKTESNVQGLGSNVKLTMSSTPIISSVRTLPDNDGMSEDEVAPQNIPAPARPELSPLPAEIGICDVFMNQAFAKEETLKRRMPESQASSYEETLRRRKAIKMEPSFSFQSNYTELLNFSRPLQHQLPPKRYQAPRQPKSAQNLETMQKIREKIQRKTQPVQHMYCTLEKHADKPRREQQIPTVVAQETLSGETIKTELVPDGTEPTDVPKKQGIKQKPVSYDDVFLYLSGAKLDKKSRNQKKVISRGSRKYLFKDGQLYYKKKGTLFVKAPYDPYLREAHDMAGHSAYRGTMPKLQSKYYWPGMSNAVNKWIENCKHCQQHKQENCEQVVLASGLTPESVNCDRCKKGRMKGRGMAADKQLEMELYADILAMDGDVPLDAFNTPGEPMNHPPQILHVGRHQQTAADDSFQYDYIVEEYENMDTEIEEEEEGETEQPKDKRQMTDPAPCTYEEIRRYLETKSYAEGTPRYRKQSIVTSVKRFRLQDGQVYLNKTNTPFVSGPKEVYLKECHEIAGHMDPKESMDALKERYYWSQMLADMKQWINNCERCTKIRNLKQYLNKRKTLAAAPERPTMKLEGFATMYMRMPMSTSTLPIQGSCTVEDKRITLKFPFTGIEFDLPCAPQEDRNDFDFKIRGARGDMTMTISYLKELRCFTGTGKQEEEDSPVLTFCFYPAESPMSKLPRS